MPIEGLTERIRFPRLGKVRLGIKKVNDRGVEYPAAVDYFVCEHPDFQAVYPGQPKELDILFPTDNPEDWARQFYYAFTRSRGKVCQGDGVTANRLIDSETGEWVIAPAVAKQVTWANGGCSGRECEYYQKKECKELMMLQFLLPNVAGLGIWQLDTGSINSILNINSAVALIKAMNHQHIAMVPLKLRIVPSEVSPEGRKKTIWVLEISTPVKLAELGGMTALPEPDDLMPEELFPTEEETVAQGEAAVADLWAAPKASSPTGHQDAPHPRDGGKALSGIKGPANARPPVAPDTSLMDLRWTEALEGLQAHLKGKDKGAWLDLPGSGQDKVSAEVLGDRLPELYAALGREPNRGTVVGVEQWVGDMRKQHNDGAIKAAVDRIILEAQGPREEEE